MTENAEQVKGVIIAVRRKTGLFSSKVYNLMVTDRRIVFAQLTKEMLHQAAADAARESKQEGKGFLTRTWATATSSRRVHQRHAEMDPQAVLAETPGNFGLALNDIKSIRFNTRTVALRAQQQSVGQQHKDQMTIKTSSGKIRLTFEYSNAHEAKTLLHSVLGKRAG